MTGSTGQARPTGTSINEARVLLGGAAAGVVWSIWSIFVNVVLRGAHYASAQQTGELLKEPRYPFFLALWIITLFVLAFGLAWLYAAVRTTLGPGPRTALRLGILAGFFAGFPVDLSLATWAPFSRYIPLWWLVDLWVGAILATLVAGWLYRDK